MYVHVHGYAYAYVYIRVYVSVYMYMYMYVYRYMYMDAIRHMPNATCRYLHIHAHPGVTLLDRAYEEIEHSRTGC